MANSYRVAVIGSTGRGDYGHGLDLAWKNAPGIEIVGVADDNPAGLAEAAKRLEVRQAFADYRQLLDTTKPEIVVIAPRWIDRHAEMAIAAAERGIHIYMEKPLCRDLVEADAVIAACDRTHARFALAHPTRHSPLWKTVRQLIRDGEIGEVLEYRARGKEDQRGGAEDLWVLGSHPIDMILDLAGSPRWCQAQVTINGRPIERADVKPGPEGLGPLAGDRVIATFGHEGGQTSYFASRRGAGRSPSRFGLQIYGTDGVIEVIQTQVMPIVHVLKDSSWSPGRSGRPWQRVSTAGVGKPEPLLGAWPNVGHGPAIVNLLTAIQTHADPVCNPRECRGIIEVILSVFDSQRLGQAVTLPLATQVNPLTLL